MKTLFILTSLLLNLSADIQMNMDKTLYKDIEQSVDQKEFIKHSQDRIIQIALKEARRLIDTSAQLQSMRGETTVSFNLNADGDMEDFYFIHESKKTDINTFARESMDYSYYRFPVFDGDIVIRINFILTPTTTQNNDKMLKMQDKMNSFSTKHPNAAMRRNR